MYMCAADVDLTCAISLKWSAVHSYHSPIPNSYDICLIFRHDSAHNSGLSARSRQNIGLNIMASAMEILG